MLTQEQAHIMELRDLVLEGENYTADTGKGADNRVEKSDLDAPLYIQYDKYFLFSC